MDKTELRNTLKENFNLETWKNILGKMFHKIDYLSDTNSIGDKSVKNGGQIGTIRLDDNHSLALFAIEVADNIDIARNRKGLRNIAIRYIDQDIIHGILVFYYSNKQVDYRLTFISKETTLNEMGEFQTKETAPKRYTFLLGGNEPCTTAAIRLYELVKKENILLSDIADTFSVERLNKDFFKGYKDRYKKFCDFLTGNAKNNRDYVKKLLGRLVFLQFLQKKGWMGVPAGSKAWEGGEKAYMQKLVEHYKNNDRLLSDVLEPLFFNTLNEARPNDIADARLGDNIKIPYLNGGLFDKDALDNRDIDFPYSYFQDLMEFFSEYNFTIDENDPDDAEVGIDPEMLGHIFENLLEDNKDKGAFYTPKEIVQYMCRETIVQYLKSHIDEQLYPAVETLIKEGVVDGKLQNKTTANEIDNLLKTVKICDPAIGSGAFPMGVLNVLYHARMQLYGFLKSTEDFSHAKVKRDIIQNNIFGVDIEQGAVDIARLRFWLALVVDETTPRPLPNLDYKIMCGNSLLSRFTQDMSLDEVFSEYNKKVEKDERLSLDIYKEKVAAFTNTSDHIQKEEYRKLIELVKQTFKYELTQKDKNKIISLQKQINNLEAPTLFERNKKELLRIKELKKQYSALLLKLEKAETCKLYEDAFEWRFEFPALIDENGLFSGFDVIIGNPPFLRIQGIKASSPEMAEELADKYDAATGSFDLYVLFVERGLQIINDTGIVNYIMPVKWTNAAFGKGLRKVISNKNAASTIINFGAYQVFNASTYTGIQWFRPNTELLRYYELNRNLATNTELKDYLDNLHHEPYSHIRVNKLMASSWVLTVGGVTALLERLEEHPRKIKDIFEKIFQGLATSKDDVYFLYDAIVEAGFITGYSRHLERRVSIEKGLVKPLLKGEDVHRYDTISTNRYVIFPYHIDKGRAVLYVEGELAAKFPKGYAYLKECEDVLRDRENGKLKNDEYWFRYIYPKNLTLFDREKLVAPDISLGGNYAYDADRKFYQTTTIYGYIKRREIKESYKFWMALLNSRLCWWYLTNTGTTLANGFFRFKPDYIKPLPVPMQIPSQFEEAIEILVDYIIVIKQAEQNNIVEHIDNDLLRRQFESIIDALIYELYFTKEFSQVGISFVDDVINDFAPIATHSREKALQIISNSFHKFRDIDNKIRNNMKLMPIKLEDLLSPILNS
ncbi:Eco57I restriction-modification methylase domain-containing protein [Prevotella koreensis]|uniref:Eco57I restriction-modification methylase domain-containing protein n=1 Tax=Prevotella koreensis TaxID=2490854 RepID=UPI0028EA3C84|nr:TaqI-like C-terminal specificity domain-containing protein [Prevotella koreensis]